MAISAESQFYLVTLLGMLSISTDPGLGWQTGWGSEAVPPAVVQLLYLEG